jgi:hypothetical protein
LGGQIKEDKMGTVHGTYGVEEKCIQDLVGKPEGIKGLRRLRRGWG